MSAMEWALSGINLALLVLLFNNYWSQMDAEDAMFAMAEEGQIEHAKCMAMVAAFTGDQFAAQVLIAAAEDYDEVEGQANLARLRETVWADEGPSMPSLWLRDRAETILAKTQAAPGD